LMTYGALNQRGIVKVGTIDDLWLPQSSGNRQSGYH
jgi:hypothetical protein